MSSASGSRPPHAPVASAAVATPTDPITEVDSASLPPSDAVVLLRERGGHLELPLEPTKYSFSLGSGIPAQVDLVVPRKYVSRLHARIERDGNWLVVRNESQNGTYFGGRREERSPVKAGETFTVGQTELLALDEHMTLLRMELLRWLGYDAHRAVDQALVDVADGHQPPLLLTGPRGSEPELLAAAIHRASPRRELPFEELDATASRTALDAAVERANGGTVYVDLRPLRDKKAGALSAALFGSGARIRPIVAAPSLDAARSTLGGRGDNPKEIRAPAVSERRADIPRLLNALLSELGSTRRLEELSPARVAAVSGFEWTDNLDDLRRSAPRLQALLEADGNLSAAARTLGVDDTTLGVALERIGAIVRARSRRPGSKEEG